MANIWKVGSRWSEYGVKGSCIVSVFRRNNVVFVGNETREIFLTEVKAGDYLAIADGYKIVSVAKVIKDAERIEDMTIKWSIKDKEWEILEDFEGYAIGAKVKIVDLKSDDHSEYKKMGSFCQIQQEDLRKKIIEKFENQGKQFSIDSYTCTLLSEKGGKILDSKTKYIIPVFQRPYSWSGEQLERFINDIFKGFWGIEKHTKDQEPMFIGTMQLSEKKFIDQTESEQLIIDGQQRLSTFWVLLKVLNILFPKNKKTTEILEKIKFNFETQVTEEQQKYLTQLFDLTEVDDNENTQNPYLRNASIIKNLFHQNIERETSENNDDFPLDKFLDYLTTQVYFVVIETYAGLSKTIQIFNAINTTGLDLNGGDIFKIRMYEYLTSVKHEYSTEAFNNITKIYNLIDEKNKDNGSPITNIHEILDIYQNYLIARYDLPVVLFDFGVDTFYERLFDSLLGIRQWEHFKNTKEVELKLQELTEIILIRYKYQWKDIEAISPENMYALNSIYWRSRYWKYWNMFYTLLYVQSDLHEEKLRENCEKLIVMLNKLFFVYSIGYDKAVNEIHTAMRNLKKQIVRDSFDNSMKTIKEKLTPTHKNWTENELNKNIAYNAKKKNLICLLSAYLDEKDKVISINDLKNKLFETWFDIEHIHANGDETIEVDEVLQNGIGNLVMLEAEINRSIQDKPFEVKREEYERSKYFSIKEIAKKEKWTENEIKERSDCEVKKILEYLYN
ncbi:MAG: DUF262 domain-containing HNH endonuclease family protein [Bacteroidales bacterium]|jgi:uncharacterized protein with ParB-like and HNH nuclease domain|nr:DUF262 domain-containing HNH endonuclease family protein [Bacteroidales bacterium]